MNRADLIDYLKQGGRRLAETQSEIERQKQRIEACNCSDAIETEAAVVLGRLQRDRIQYALELERLRRQVMKVS